MNVVKNNNYLAPSCTFYDTEGQKVQGGLSDPTVVQNVWVFRRKTGYRNHIKTDKSKMNVEKEQTGNPGAIHHGRVNGEREESAEVTAAISCPSDRF